MDGVKTVYFSAFRKVKILDEELLKCYNTKAGKYREKRIVRATVRLSELLPVRTVLFPRGRIDL